MHALLIYGGVICMYVYECVYVCVCVWYLYIGESILELVFWDYW
jgi:hypothetical protein